MAKKTQKELRDEAKLQLCNNEYCMHWWQGWRYSTLKHIRYLSRRVKDEWYSTSDAIIMADTETSKEAPNALDKDGKYVPVQNHVVAWTISIRAYGINVVTLYGKKPSEMVRCIELIKENLRADFIYVYFHNLAYDWVFLRKFMIKEWDIPERALNTKPHYPIELSFKNGIILKDSLVLAQRNLEKWAKDMDVEHQKATGKWDYEAIRHQTGTFTSDELEYIEHDTLAGVECIEKTLELLNKKLQHIPYTATGIPREETRKRGAPFKAHQKYVNMAPTYFQQITLDLMFHGGFVHANRHLLNRTLTKDLLDGDLTKCFDFASSYPFCVLAFKYPMSEWHKIANTSVSAILEKKDDYCFYFKLIMIKPRLKDPDFPMPALQFSKCTHTINPILDNGRILGADYAEIYLTEIDLEVIDKIYTWDSHICVDVHYAEKGRLPKWFTDYIYELFEAKTKLKGIDNIRYSLRKATLNAASFGMCVQKPIRDEIQENYDTGEYIVHQRSPIEAQEEYEKHVKKRGSILNFSWGVYITAYAMRNLFKLGECCGIWEYSDTDSIYGAHWDLEKLEAYNEWCKDLIREAGYGPVIFKGREYWPGVAEHDGDKDTYTEFRVQGAKRYAGRCKADGEIHTTVAGVPKEGAKCLKNDLENFCPGFIFKGEETGKLTHSYIYAEDITVNEFGDEIGDSIDLTPCDYKLDGVVEEAEWWELMNEYVEVPTFGDDHLYDYGGIGIENL